MDKYTKIEARLRTLKLNAQEQNKAELDKLELRLSRIYVQTHETVSGIRRPLTKRRKLALWNKVIDRYERRDTLDISQDSINMLKALDV